MLGKILCPSFFELNKLPPNWKLTVPIYGLDRFRPPRPFLLKGRADEGPLESLSCRLCPWSLESFRLDEDEALGRSLLKFWDRCWVPERAL